jgi:hypothetical protein
VKSTFQIKTKDGKHYCLEVPSLFPVSRKEFLRIVVGGTIPSARTETDRIRWLRDYFAFYQGTRENAETTLAHWQSTALDEATFYGHADFFAAWASGILRRRAVAARKKVTKPFGKSIKPFDKIPKVAKCNKPTRKTHLVVKKGSSRRSD